MFLYEKRVKNKIDYIILIFFIDSNVWFLMKGVWCVWCKFLVLMMFLGWINYVFCFLSKY